MFENQICKSEMQHSMCGDWVVLTIIKALNMLANNAGTEVWFFSIFYRNANNLVSTPYANNLVSTPLRFLGNRP